MKFRPPNIIGNIKNGLKLNLMNETRNMKDDTTYPQTEKERRRCSSGDTIQDRGNAPLAFDIDSVTKNNQNFRTALWTGKQLQLTAMSIPTGESTGIEMHENTDQFLRIEDGNGEVEMGRLKGNMNYKEPLNKNSAILVPAGTYHIIKNIGKMPLKLYSIYSPPHHPFGTVDKTKADSEERDAEGDAMT